MTTTDNHHPTVHLVAGGFEADVDEDLAPILRLTWEAGIETMSGCQNAAEGMADLLEREPHMVAYVEAHKDRAYIDFYPGGIEAFLTLVSNGKPDDEMDYRIYHWCAPGAWGKRLHVLPWDGVFQIQGAQLSFPVSDIPLIVECLERASA
jgi:hypothetical protein